MKQTEKIITILNNITNINLDDFYYSLTINYENIVHNFEYKKVNLDEISEIINSFKNKIETFNLSFNNYGKYCEERYKSYYYNVDFIFHTDGIVFNFNSKYLANREIVVSDVDKLIDIYDEHKNSSKRLYDIVSF